MKRLLNILYILIISMFAFSCGLLESDDEDSESAPETLHIYYTNQAASVATITSIITQPMGNAGEADSEPTGDWGTDILGSGEAIAPGETVEFTLEIPNLHWVRYRVAIDDGNGNELWLHEQENYGDGNYPMTHWGSDERDCYILISKYNDNYYVQGWGDNAR